VTALTLLQGCAAVIVGSAATSAVVAAQDRRTAGTIVEDTSIQIKALQAVKDQTMENPNIHVSVISYNNRVLLIGQVPSQKIRSDIEQSVKKIEKVRQVHNEMLVKAPTSIKVRSSDSWITAKVKSEMAVTRDINPTRVKVTTEDGIVYMMGIVKPFEEEITVDIARHTKGVKKVVKIFEYD
jgi:osmotically-inducible protein OsmY